MLFRSGSGINHGTINVPWLLFLTFHSMDPSDLPMTDITEAVRHSLDELGVRDAAALGELFTRLENQWRDEAAPLLEKGALPNDIEALRVRWLGRKQGIIRSISDNWLARASSDLKREVGRLLNGLRQEAESRIEELVKRHSALLNASSEPAPPPVVWKNQQYHRPSDLTYGEAVPPLPGPEIGFSGARRTAELESLLDITLPGTRRSIGARHPLRIVMDDITEIFFSLGYSVEEGPEIESAYYNFEALNIPEDHPSRDDQDTFYIDPQTVLRTHTSPVQVRTMERQQPPVRIIVPGKAYRHDAPDATHSSVFHQVEGLAVDTHISLADLKGTLDYLMKSFFGPSVRTRLRPSFFPFTEPSAEVDISCLFCGGKTGCRICKQSGWIELGGCGMVDPALYSYVKYDASKFSGFAFGMGLERLAMLKYGIPDIQLFYQGDVRFLRQFR